MKRKDIESEFQQVNVFLRREYVEKLDAEIREISNMMKQNARSALLNCILDIHYKQKDWADKEADCADRLDERKAFAKLKREVNAEEKKAARAEYLHQGRDKTGIIV